VWIKKVLGEDLASYAAINFEDIKWRHRKVPSLLQKLRKRAEELIEWVEEEK